MSQSQLINSANPKGAGRKPLPFKTKQVRIPEPLIPEILEMIERFKKQNPD